MTPLVEFEDKLIELFYISFCRICRAVVYLGKKKCYENIHVISITGDMKKVTPPQTTELQLPSTLYCSGSCSPLQIPPGGITILPTTRKNKNF